MRSFRLVLVALWTLVTGVGMAGVAQAGPFEDGLSALDRFDTRAAVAALSVGAEAGDARAQAALADLYLTGRGVPLSGLVAARWLRRAAAQNDADAQARLGVMLLNGRGVRMDAGEGARLIRLAALQGQVNAQNCLAGLYAMGVGVPRDPVSAFVWYSLAADHPGQSNAAANRDLFAARLTADQLDLAQRRIELRGPSVFGMQTTPVR